MKNLLRRVSDISKKYDQLQIISGNNFNIFNIINLTTEEVRVHSKFLAELLSPKGSHGQGDIFLKLFTKQLNIDFDTLSAKVKIEKYIGVLTPTTGGYIDIYISDNKGNSITIENKIYAKDQDNQLLRYFNFNPNNILYLTLFGDEPDAMSYQLNDENKLDIEKDIQLISYRTDISEWLTNCRKEAVELPLLREGITHYMNLIQILTGQTGTTKMNNEITDFIILSKNNLKQSVLVADNLNAAKIKIQWSFWESLKAKLTNKGIELLEEKSVTRENVYNYYNKSRNKDIYFGLWSKVYQKEDVTIHFGIEIYDEIYFGFTMERNNIGRISHHKENLEFKELVADINSNYRGNENWLGYRNLDENLNFRNFNSDAIFELAENEILNSKTEVIANDILADINSLKEKLEKI